MKDAFYVTIETLHAPGHGDLENVSGAVHALPHVHGSLCLALGSHPNLVPSTAQTYMISRAWNGATHQGGKRRREEGRDVIKKVERIEERMKESRIRGGRIKI